MILSFIYMHDIYQRKISYFNQIEWYFPWLKTIRAQIFGLAIQRNRIKEVIVV
jgi:hypothetical protein